jgi:hypothetical protein
VLGMDWLTLETDEAELDIGEPHKHWNPCNWQLALG